MGNYNSHYESYYRSMVNRGKSRLRYAGGSSNTSFESRITKRLTRDLIGVLVLFIFVLGCKTIVNPMTQKAYGYFNTMVNKQYDYKGFYENIKTFQLSGIQESIIGKIEEVRCSIFGEKTFKERLKEDFDFPSIGRVIKTFGEKSAYGNYSEINKGIDIALSKDEKVKAVSIGKVKECGENEKLGKYIILDHGDGIETVYSNLGSILVNKGDSVSKSQLIGASNIDINEKTSAFHFELLYMGHHENPQEYMK